MFLQTRIDESRMVCITICFYRFGCRDSYRQVYDGVNYNPFLQILVYRLVKTNLGWMPACACARIFHSQIFIWLWVEAFELERLAFPTFFHLTTKSSEHLPRGDMDTETNLMFDSIIYLSSSLLFVTFLVRRKRISPYRLTSPPKQILECRRQWRSHLALL